jgi:four helix bundle protein
MAFSHEKLIVYQKSLEFNRSAYGLIKKQNIKGDLKDQISRASHSIALNIAEGNGKFSKNDRANFLDRSQGSATECAATLDLLVTEDKITQAEANSEKAILEEIVRILVKMTQNLRTKRVNEDPSEYGHLEIDKSNESDEEEH